MAGLADCESLCSLLKTKKMAAGRYLARHFLSLRLVLEARELDDAYWVPGAENPADELTKVRSDMAPLLRLSESGRFNP